MDNNGVPGKPRDTQCDKYCNGCTIYENRPKVCADFQCLWLRINTVSKKNLPAELRPNKCGVMVTFQFEDGAGRLILHEVEENSFDINNPTPEQQQILVETLHVMANQSFPTTLHIQHYDWRTTQVNVKVEQK
jgi:hypothetical protein